jgi:hypothetical protein
MGDNINKYSILYCVWPSKFKDAVSFRVSSLFYTDIDSEKVQ